MSWPELRDRIKAESGPHSGHQYRPSGFGQREDDAAPQSQMLELTRSVLPRAPE